MPNSIQWWKKTATKVSARPNIRLLPVGENTDDDSDTIRISRTSVPPTSRSTDQNTTSYNCFGTSETSTDDSEMQITEIRDRLSGLLEKVKIADRPYTNSAGLCQYEFDVNNDAIRKRRCDLARSLGFTPSDAISQSKYHRHLAQRVANEFDQQGFMFGKCAEMAALAANLLTELAMAYNKHLYIFQLPDSNHTLVLMSVNQYKSNERINWKKEYASQSITVDLWQAGLDKKMANLACLSSEHRYTRKPRTRGYIQAKI